MTDVSGADLAVIIPLWRRVENMARASASVWDTVPEARIVWVGSQDDERVREGVGDWYEAGRDRGRFTVCWMEGPGGGTGDYARKINHGYRMSSEPVLFTGADDIVFRPGWYEAARPLLDVPEQATQVLSRGATLTGPFQIPRIGVVGTNDGSNPRTFHGEHSTHSLVARWYADQGACVEVGHIIYCELYEHEYCDDELVQTAMVRDAWAHAPDALVEHFHPIVGPHAGEVPDDITYQRGRSRTRHSRALFLRRRALWGGR